VFALALSLLLGHASDARADPPPAPFTLEAAVAFALAHHPALRAAQATERIAAAQLELARTDLLPQLGVSAELNRATGNVVPGAFVQITGFPTLSGPLRDRTLDAGVWGSGLSLWASWDVLDLVRQMRVIDARLADARETHAATAVRRLEVAFAAADAFLALLAAYETVRAVRAHVERTEVLLTAVRTLSEQGLRPGADRLRAEAEAALAATVLARAEQAVAEQRARLAEALGIAGQPVEALPGTLLEPVPAEVSVPSALARHPLLVQADAAVESAVQQRAAVALEYLPRVELVGALWLRGNGFFPGGLELGAAQGLLPDTPNWCVGVVAVWPALELFAVRARVHAASARGSLARARRDELAQALLAQLETARATLLGALRVARLAPASVTAAHAAAEQARARYQAGLAPVLEVAEALRLLAQAELDDANARLQVHRARLLLARALGDLGPFLVQARAGTEGS
jgi:outer membrane protein TolC